MSKHKHNKKDNYQFAQSMKGLIPWSTKEYFEAIEWMHKLKSTPKDDWDLERMGLSIIDDKTGKTQRLEFNPFIPEYQFSGYMFKKYKNRSKYLAHSLRYFQMNDFLRENMDKLIGEGLIEKAKKEGLVFICEPLMNALCILPYSEEVKIKGGKEYHFSYTEVIQKAKEPTQKEET